MSSKNKLSVYKQKNFKLTIYLRVAFDYYPSLPSHNLHITDCNKAASAIIVSERKNAPIETNIITGVEVTSRIIESAISAATIVPIAPTIKHLALAQVLDEKLIFGFANLVVINTSKNTRARTAMPKAIQAEVTIAAM